MEMKISVSANNGAAREDYVILRDTDDKGADDYLGGFADYLINILKREYGYKYDHTVRFSDGRTKKTVECCADFEQIFYHVLCSLGDSETLSWNDSDFKEVCYRGRIYSSISNVKGEFDINEAPDGSPLMNMSFSAIRGGEPVNVYVFESPLVRLWEEGLEEVRGASPYSIGIAVLRSNNRVKSLYAGSFYYANNESDFKLGYRSDHIHTFLETDGDNYIITGLIQNKRYKLVQKTKDEVVFFSSIPSQEDKPVGLNSEKKPGSVTFRNENGTYIYTNEEQTCTFEYTPPQVPALDKLDNDSAHAFCSMDNLFSTRNITGMKFGDLSFKQDSCGAYYTMGNKHSISVSFSYEMCYRDTYTQTFESIMSSTNLCVERIVFYVNGYFIIFYVRHKRISQDDVEINLTYDNDNRDDIFTTTFSFLRSRGFFDKSRLPDEMFFSDKLDGIDEMIPYYEIIRDVVVKNKNFILEILSDDNGEGELSFEDMQNIIYGDDSIPDKDVVEKACQLFRKYKRTGKIPNLAIIGEAGCGKSCLVENLAKIFGKGVYNLSPSDLKGSYIGHTKFEVLKCLKNAAIYDQVFFIDEAYELMTDSFGQEAVALLLPLMTGQRYVFDENKDKIKMHIDFLSGEYTEGDKTGTFPKGIPPIWIAGYDSDVRLMVSQNQGLFRRLDWLTLKSPYTDTLYRLLIKKAEAIIDIGGSEPTKAQKKLRDRGSMLLTAFDVNKNQITSFLRWGTQPQNSRYFANYAGVENFFSTCLDRIDFTKPDTISLQIENIITSTKRNIHRQLDIKRRSTTDYRGIPHAAASAMDSVEILSDVKTRFTDLVGCDEQIEFMKTIIDLLKNRNKYAENKITIPKGALMEGVPGVGKTYIAGAFAGELQQAFEQKDKTGVSSTDELSNKRIGFMSLSAPELTSKEPSFIASLFDETEVYDACVIFIDEVDAIAKARSENRYYSHLIELIKQMDGIDNRSNVFILAATNAPESLDPAFVRSGRIDKRLAFTLPNPASRQELARRAIKKRCSMLRNFIYDDNEDKVKKLAREIADRTPDFTPKAIENIINEGFILYGQQADEVPEGDIKIDFGNRQLNILFVNIYEAIEIMTMGSARPADREPEFTVEKNDFSCSAVAIHEVGHALVSIMCGLEPFEKITSLPRGRASGYVSPKAQRLVTKADYENDIRVCMGGRIAEETVYGSGNISVGANNDMHRATELAHVMVDRLGFTSEFEFMSLAKDTSAYLGGEKYTCSEAFREQSDKAANRLLKQLYRETSEMLADKRELIVTLAKEVFDRRTMSGSEFLDFYRNIAQ